MKIYARTFLIAGVIVPICMHLVASESMPWWPDTVSTGIAFGVTSVVVLSKARTDRAMNRRLWKALRTGARNRDAN